MTAQELATAVQYHTNTKIVVMNNNYLGMVRQWQEIFLRQDLFGGGNGGYARFRKAGRGLWSGGLRGTKPAELNACSNKDCL